MRYAILISGALAMLLGVAAADVTIEPIPSDPPTASRPATAPGSGGSTRPATQAATKPADDQDGPGLYRISAGAGGKFTATVRAKSRQDAIKIAMRTVVLDAVDHDENVEVKELKVEKIGP